MGDLGSIPGLLRSPGEGKGYPLQSSGLENSMDCPWDRKKSDMTERLSLHFTSLPVSLPGKSHGQRSLVGYSPLGHKELDVIEKLNNNSKNDFYRLANKFEDKISFQLLRHSGD